MKKFANLPAQTESPTLPSRYGSTQAGSWEHDPELHMRHGWREITDDEQPQDGYRATEREYLQDPDDPQGAWSRITEQRLITDLEAEQAEADRLARIEGYRLTTEQTAPLLPDHPDPSDVPDTGMFYRLSDDTGIVTLWFARQSDLISTQLSSHDNRGHRIMADVDLKTRESIAIDMTEWVGSLAPGLRGRVERKQTLPPRAGNNPGN